MGPFSCLVHAHAEFQTRILVDSTEGFLRVLYLTSWQRVRESNSNRFPASRFWIAGPGTYRFAPPAWDPYIVSDSSSEMNVA